MLHGRLKLQLFAFLLLSGGVAANLLLQSRSRDVEEAHLAAGETGSVGRSGLAGTGGALSRLADDMAIGGATGMIATVQIPEDTMDVTRAVQRELQARGYETGAPEGVPSLLTSAAIMGFEHDHGLSLTGRPSQELLKYILLGANATAKPIGSTGKQSAEAQNVIRSVQKALAKLGYRPGRIDGKFSPATVQAIREFEVDQALPKSGRVSGPLFSRLARLTGEG